MINLVRTALLKTYIYFKYWRNNRLVRDSAEFNIPIASLEGEVFMVDMPGEIVRLFSWVELNLMYGPGWSDEHLFAFYDGVIQLSALGILTKPRLLMFLHPEGYYKQQVEGEVELLLESGGVVLMLSEPTPIKKPDDEEDDGKDLVAV